MSDNEQPPRLWRRIGSGRRLALGALGTLIVVLILWTRAPAEPTPGPPRLPPPAGFEPETAPEDRPGTISLLPEAAAPAAEPGPEATGPDDSTLDDDAPEVSTLDDAAPDDPTLEAAVPDGAPAREEGATLAELAAAREEVVRTCERIAGRLGSVSLEDCTQRPLALSGARSTQGTPILVAEYPPLPDRQPLGRVLLFGGIHGDELSSVSIVFGWLDTLDRYHSGLFHWRIAPLVNPDGLLRRPAQRMNDRGVDLNRNFPSPNWLVEAPDYWIRRTSRNPRRYPGEAPLSEPESRWLHEQIETFEPAAIVAVHAPLHVLDYDGPPDPPQRLGPLHLKQMGTYPGSLGRFAGIHLGLPVVTLELPSAGIMPTADEQRRMWVDLVAWLRQNVPKHEPSRLARASRETTVPSTSAQR